MDLARASLLLRRATGRCLALGLEHAAIDDLDWAVNGADQAKNPVYGSFLRSALSFDFSSSEPFIIPCPDALRELRVLAREPDALRAEPPLQGPAPKPLG